MVRSSNIPRPTSITVACGDVEDERRYAAGLIACARLIARVTVGSTG